MTYISRANGQSVMAACAYYDGEQKYSEYDHQWKYPHSQPERVVLHEVMLLLSTQILNGSGMLLMQLKRRSTHKLPDA